MASAPAADAREDYLRARDGFQNAKGFHGRNGGTTQRLDGALSQRLWRESSARQWLHVLHCRHDATG